MALKYFEEFSGFDCAIVIADRLFELVVVW
jgi:hypothetical protein